MNKLAVMLFTLLAIAPSVIAAESINKSKRNWKASAELGIIDTSGDTDGTLAKFKANFEYDGDIFRNTLEFDSLYKQDESTVTEIDDNTGEEVERKDKNTTEHKFNFAVQSNYKMQDDNQAIFSRLAYDENRFSSFEYQASLSFGYNTRLMRSDYSFLDISIGPGVAFESSFVDVVNEVTNETKQITEEDEYLQIYTAAKYERKLSESAYFSQSLTIESSQSNNTKTVSETAISAAVNGSLALKASVEITHNSEVEDGFDNTSTVTAATLVYTF